MTEAFIRANTAPGTAPLVPEIVLQLATEITPIWQATESFLAREGMAPPYWAFAWPGSQALARRVLDEPGRVRGRRVLDFASGSGLAAIACAMAGAQVTANEIDPLACTAIRLNAAANGVALEVAEGDLIGQPGVWDVILCGDICYEAPMTAHILPWLRAQAAEAEVWVADPGRAYVPDGMDAVATMDVPTSRELEDRETRRVTIWRLLP